MTISLDPRISEVVNNSILVTGPARSGTTLMGNMLHSCRGVEYCFEPPVVLTLLPLLGSMSSSDWKALFETSLVRDFMVDRVAGRNMNLNPYDDSNFVHAKGVKECEERVMATLNTEEALALCSKRTLVWKCPEASFWLKDLTSLYPGLRTVVMYREPWNTAKSLISRGWFSGPSSKWWVRLNDEFPMWMDKAASLLTGLSGGVVDWDIRGEWWTHTEEERVLVYWVLTYLFIGRASGDRRMVKLRDISSEWPRLIRELGLSAGDMTDMLLKEIREPEPIEMIPDRINSATRKLVEKVDSRVQWN